MTDAPTPAKTCTKSKVLVDLRVILEPGYRMYGTLEQQARELEGFAQELRDFIRDHRSRDRTTIEVERVYEQQCSACHTSWEPTEHDGKTICAGCGAEVAP